MNKMEFCKECDKKVEVEVTEEEEGIVMCFECGEEFKPLNVYDGFVVSKVLSVEEVPKKKDLKKVKLDIGEGEDKPVQVVTNAKHVTVNSLVVVCTVGTVYPAGAKLDEDSNAVEVKKASVGGVKSEGVLCDAWMLWGGSKGTLQVLPDSDFKVGDLPPSSKPMTKA